MLGWAVKSGSQGGRDAKKIKTSSDLPEELKALIVSLTKSVLNAHQRIRILEGCLFKTFLMKTDDKLIVNMNSHSNYKKQVENQPDHKLGAPGVHIWASLITSCKGLANSTESAVIDKHMSECVDPVALSSRVMFCKVGVCFDRGFSKLQFYVTADLDSVVQVVFAILMRNGASYKPGAPPMSGLERDLQKLFDRVTS